MTNRVIEKKVLIEANLESVFNALTFSQEIIKYFPLTSVESEWLVGSEIKLVGESDGGSFTDYGIIEVLNRPFCFQYSYWSDNHGTVRDKANHVIITYELEPYGNGTMLKIRQSNLPSDELHHLMSEAVWPYLLDSLKKHIERIT